MRKEVERVSRNRSCTFPIFSIDASGKGSADIGLHAVRPAVLVKDAVCNLDRLVARFPLCPLHTTRSARVAVGNGEKVQRICNAFDELVADEVHVSDMRSYARNAEHGIAEVADGRATAFLVMRLRKPRFSDDVVDVVNAGNGIRRMFFGIALLDRQIAGKELIRIVLKRSADIGDARSDVGRMLPRTPCFPSAVVRRRILIF